MKQLFLIAPGYYPDSNGGAARQASILASALGELGLDVTLVAPTKDRDAQLIEDTSFGRVERFLDTAYPSQGGRSLPAFVRWTRWFRNTYRGRITSETPVYIFHARLHALGPTLAALEAGAPVAIKLGGGGEASDFAALRAKRYVYGKFIQNFLLKKVDRFVANGAQIVADLAELGVPEAKVAAFSNGVIVPPLEKLIDANQKRSGARFIYAGRLVADKRLHVLYEAALRLSENKFTATVAFLGDGPEGQQLAAQAASLKIANNIEFLGFRDDVYPELWRSDFFLSASMREGQSNALLEAMSAGLIPIIYGASGAGDVIEHGRTGFLVNNSEPEDFVEAMQFALTMPRDQRVQMSMAAQKFASECIGINAIAQKTISMFNDVYRIKRNKNSL
jgi:glycosyltransferase involved in cell wall biosynthesis